MNSRERVMAVFQGLETDRAAIINLTSVLTLDSMNALGLKCPDVHLDAEKMAAAAAAAHELCGFDSVMPKFSIVHSAAALGAQVDWRSGDSMPVIRKNPISDPEQFIMPDDFLDRPETKVLLDAIRLLKKRYGDTVAICGKVFGPWTTSYNMCGTENFLMGTVLEPEKTRRYLEVFTAVGVRYAEAQFEAGADMILWCDHASGDMCSPATYAKFLLPVHQRIFQTLLKKSGPVVLHACGRTLDRIKYFAEAGFDAFHFDSLNDTRQALKEAGPKMLLTGGLSNETLLNGTPEKVEKEVTDLLDAGIRLISPECAIPMKTPNANLSAIRRAVEKYKGYSRFPIPDSLSLAFADLAPQERELRIETVSRQQAAPGLFTVTRNAKIVGAVYSELRSDKTLLLWPPGTLEENTEVRSALYRRIDLYAEETGADPIIAFVEDRPREELEQAGFEYVSNILTLIADEVSFPMVVDSEGDSGRLSFVTGQNDTIFEDMTPLFERTFEQTNDFPTLVGVTPTAEVLRSYQTGAGYRPELWFFAQHDTENVGCLILADHPEFGQLELLYLGILPEHRGRKYSYAFVQHAQRIARRLGRRMVTVAVDSQNQAALRVYIRCGFRQWSKKSLFLKKRS
ncbi:MAG: MtaA/CmuA family methyltransferase [Planctomycetaceae bacterium]|nr:MtaA/CmuA family methyltransferase [Planctomycetaceae bacterium]